MQTRGQENSTWLCSSAVWKVSFISIRLQRSHWQTHTWDRSAEQPPLCINSYTTQRALDGWDVRSAPRSEAISLTGLSLLIPVGELSPPSWSELLSLSGPTTRPLHCTMCPLSAAPPPSHDQLLLILTHPSLSLSLFLALDPISTHFSCAEWSDLD